MKVSQKIKNRSTILLSTIAKIWKQPKFQSTDEWIEMMWYIYTMEYYSTSIFIIK